MSIHEYFKRHFYVNFAEANESVLRNDFETISKPSHVGPHTTVVS